MRSGCVGMIRAIQLAPGPVQQDGFQCDMTDVAWSVSARGLNASLPRRVHPESIELVFYE